MATHQTKGWSERRMIEATCGGSEQRGGLLSGGAPSRQRSDTRSSRFRIILAPASSADCSRWSGCQQSPPPETSTLVFGIRWSWQGSRSSSARFSCARLSRSKYGMKWRRNSAWKLRRAPDTAIASERPGADRRGKNRRSESDNQ